MSPFPGVGDTGPDFPVIALSARVDLDIGSANVLVLKIPGRKLGGFVVVPD